MGAATYVLVPGAASGPWYWHQVVDELTSRGNEVVAVDLPCEDADAGLDRYAEATVDAIGDRRDLVLVGHSFGAFTATAVCNLIRVDLLVLLAPMVPYPGVTAGEWWGATGQPEAKRVAARRGGWPDSDDPAVIFFHDVPDDVAAEVVRRERDQAARPFEDIWPLRAWPDVPTRVIIGRDDRFLPRHFQHEVVSERLGIVPDEIDGGHLAPLTRPVELADRLEDLRNQLVVRF